MDHDWKRFTSRNVSCLSHIAFTRPVLAQHSRRFQSKTFNKTHNFLSSNCWALSPYSDRNPLYCGKSERTTQQARLLGAVFGRITGNEFSAPAGCRFRTCSASSNCDAFCEQPVLGLPRCLFPSCHAFVSDSSELVNSGQIVTNLHWIFSDPLLCFVPLCADFGLTFAGSGFSSTIFSSSCSSPIIDSQLELCSRGSNTSNNFVFDWSSTFCSSWFASTGSGGVSKVSGSGTSSSGVGSASSSFCESASGIRQGKMKFFFNEFWIMAGNFYMLSLWV